MEIAKYLVANGADCQLLDKDKKKASEVATRNKGEWDEFFSKPFKDFSNYILKDNVDPSQIFVNYRNIDEGANELVKVNFKYKAIKRIIRDYKEVTLSSR